MRTERCKEMQTAMDTGAKQVNIISQQKGYE